MECLEITMKDRIYVCDPSGVRSPVKLGGLLKKIEKYKRERGEVNVGVLLWQNMSLGAAFTIETEEEAQRAMALERKHQWGAYFYSQVEIEKMRDRLESKAYQ